MSDRARSGFVPEVFDASSQQLFVTNGADGTIDVPQEPGLGVHLDRWKLRRWGKRFHVTTPLRVAVKTIREKGHKTALELKDKIADLQNAQKAARQMYDAACQRLGIPNALEENDAGS